MMQASAIPLLLLASLLGAVYTMPSLVGGGVSLLETRTQNNMKHESVLGPAGHPKDEDPEPWVEQVGLRPQVYYYHNFLTEEERTHMIRLAAPMMKRSVVVGKKGEGTVDNIRTSYGMFIRRKQDPIIARVEQRIALMTQIPIVHQEDIQVLRYTHGQKYDAHYDSMYDEKAAGPHQRMATFYMYLSDVEEGGETAFPKNSRWYDPAMANTAHEPSECAKGHVHAKPKAGDAVLFYSYFANGTMDPASMHTGCPVLKGIKWGAPVWIHIDEFNPSTFDYPPTREETTEPGLCEDYHPRCKEWASKGECERSRGFMVGEAGPNVGTCRHACNMCKPCHPSDQRCIRENRQELGFLDLDRDEFEWLGLDWWIPESPDDHTEM